MAGNDDAGSGICVRIDPATVTMHPATRQIWA